jgi:ATP-dependent Clp protease ATP-binding subunit ClpC
MPNDLVKSQIFQEEDFVKDSKGRVSVFFRGKVLFFGTNFKKSLIFLRGLKKKADKVIDFTAYLLGTAGIIALVFWAYLNIEAINLNPRELLFFYQDDHPLIIAFLVSLIFDMFVVYRISEKKASLKKIKKIKEKKLTPDHQLDFKKLGKIDVSEALNEELLSILEKAYLLAHKLNQKKVSTVHVFWCLLYSPRINGLLTRLNVDINKLADLLKKYLADNKKEGGESVSLSDHVQEILLSAFADAYENKKDSIGVLNMVLFCYYRNPVLKEILYELDISQSKIENTVKWFRINDRMVEDYKIFKRMARLKPASDMNKSYTAVATPTLDYFSRDMTVMAKYGYYEACVARDKEINQIFESFESGYNGVLLSGHNGVGKKTIIEGLAQLMVKEDVPKFLKDKRLVELNVSRLVGGSSPAQAQERLLQVLHEMRKSRNVILYIENIENLMGISAGSEESLELSEVLSESLSSRSIFCLASISSENYSKYLEGKALAGTMSLINVSEPDFDDAIYMLESKVSWIENKYGVYFDYNSLEETVKLAARYISDKFLPEKAVDVIKQAAVRISKLAQKDPSRKICTKDDIAEVISDMTGILVSKVSESEGEKLMNLEKKIHERMIGQEEAVKAVSGSLRRSRAELREGNRPIASFLFLGPTGVGKTELAKSVAEIYFGDENSMIRLDMSEYQLADSVKKMIGDGAFLGYLTEAVRKKPFSLILFDEIEKAHSDILNLFLQILDDGRLTDGQGKTINFTNSIIISTSNAGSLFIQEAVKKSVEIEIIKQELIDTHLNKVMRPELINRFDGIMVFKPLSLENILSISKLMIAKIKKSLEPKGINLLYDEDGLLRLAKAGYDPKFGARPLRRLLQDKIENEIANLILSEKLKRRDTVFINENGDIEVEEGKKL